MLTDVFRVSDMAVLCTDAAASFGLSSDILGSSAGVSEEVTELALELERVIKLGSSLRAFEVEPQNAIHDTSVSQNSIAHSFLKQAVHVVLLKCSALVRSLLRRLVE